jgi:hypothetical protein
MSDERPDPRPAREMVEPDAARQSVKTGHLRWVLTVGLLLGVLALAGAYVWSEASHVRPPEQPAAHAS